MSEAPLGPFVAMAVLCQRVDRQPDGTVDVIGVVDGVAIDQPEVLVPGQDGPVVSLTALVSVRAGDLRGRHALSVRGQYPSGSDGPSVARPVDFTDSTPGATLAIPLELELDGAGTYWFDVYCNDRLVTRIPLVVHLTGARTSLN